jgi:hypothetical protein
MLKALRQSPSLRVGAAFALGGAAFAGGNLIMARALPAEAYGLVSLVIGLFSVSSQVAPLGLDLAIARRGLPLGPGLRRAALIASLASALGTAWLSWALYRLSPALVLSVLVATAGAGMSQAAAAHYQSQQRFRASVPLLQAFNWLLLPIGMITLWSHATDALLPCTLMAAAALGVGIAGWGGVIRQRGASDPRATPELLRTALLLLTLMAAVSLFLNLERLVLPRTLPLRDLALFGVLAALVGSPFRMLQAAVSFTILPRLRDTADPAARRRILGRELWVVTATMIPGILAIWTLAPPLARWLLGGRYELHPALVAATVVSGVLKVYAAAGTAAVTALAPESEVRLLSGGSWLCIAVAVAGSFCAARWGLAGVIYAVSLGWLLRCAVAVRISLPHFSALPHPAATGR